MVQYCTISVIRHNEHHLHSTLCRAHFWTRRTGISPFDRHFRFGPYERAKVSSIASKKVIFSLLPLQQGLCHCIAVPFLRLGKFGYPTRCKFSVTQNDVQNAEQFRDILRLPLLTHAQSIGDEHPAGKQGVQLCCSPHGVVLYGGVLTGIPAYPEQFNPSCHCDMATLHRPKKQSELPRIPI